MQPFVFISYSHVDKQLARRLSKRLAKIGINFFLDEKNIEWGSTITDKVRESLNECAAIIVIVSPASLKSAWVPFEVGQAVSAGKRVLPLLTHPALDIPLYLADLNCIKQISEALRYFESDSWKQYLSSVTAAPSVTSEIAKPIQPTYGILLTSVLKLIHVYSCYASNPPTATYDEYVQRTAAVRDWLFDNKLECDSEVYEQGEGVIIKIRGYINFGRAKASIIGGDGRPNDKELAEQEKELLQDAKSIEQKIRSIQK